MRCSNSLQALFTVDVSLARKRATSSIATITYPTNYDARAFPSQLCEIHPAFQTAMILLLPASQPPGRDLVVLELPRNVPSYMRNLDLSSVTKS